MPKLDGLEVCDTIRQVEDTPIILLTARGEEHDRSWHAIVWSSGHICCKPKANIEISGLSSGQTEPI